MRLILNKNQFHTSKITNFCLENILKGQTSPQGFQGVKISKYQEEIRKRAILFLII